jgi:hypothetical protein
MFRRRIRARTCAHARCMRTRSAALWVARVAAARVRAVRRASPGGATRLPAPRGPASLRQTLSCFLASRRALHQEGACFLASRRHKGTGKGRERAREGNGQGKGTGKGRERASETQGSSTQGDPPSSLEGRLFQTAPSSPRPGRLPVVRHAHVCFQGIPRPRRPSHESGPLAPGVQATSRGPASALAPGFGARAGERLAGAGASAHRPC